MDKLKKQMDFIIEIDKLKSIFRQTLITDGTRFENDAEHSWHMCMIAVILEDYAPKGTDLLKCLKMILIHDLVEIYAGDTYLYDEKGYQDKEIREKEAADKLYNMLDEKGTELKKLWYEFEENKTKEAIFANSLDRLQPVMLNYMTKGKTWKKHGVKKHQVLSNVNKAMENGNTELKNYVLNIIEESCKKGYLDE